MGRKKDADDSPPTDFVPGLLVGLLFGGSLAGLLVRVYLRFDIDESADRLRIQDLRLRQAERMHPGSTRISRFKS